MTSRSENWPSYVINMAENTTRMENVSNQMAEQNIAFVRVNAVDGRKFDEAETSKVYDAAANKKYGKYPLVGPEIGCYLSHINAWRTIAEGDAEGGFIFEDDFQSDQYLKTVLTALSNDERDWDMVKLFAFNPAVPLANGRELTPDHIIGFPYRVPTCLIGYGVTKLAAQSLVKRADQARFFRPVDEDQKFVWETGLRVALVARPPIQIGDQTAQSGTVSNARRGLAHNGISAKIRKALHVFWYAFRYNYHLHKYKRKGRRS